MPHLRPDTWDPVDSPVITPAVKQKPSQFPLKLGLGDEKFHPQALGGGAKT
jgi:hypothetical protein